MAFWCLHIVCVGFELIQTMNGKCQMRPPNGNKALEMPYATKRKESPMTSRRFSGMRWETHQHDRRIVHGFRLKVCVFMCGWKVILGNMTSFEVIGHAWEDLRGFMRQDEDDMIARADEMWMGWFVGGICELYVGAQWMSCNLVGSIRRPLL